MVSNTPKVLVIGLDSMPSTLFNNDIKKDLPNISMMIEKGISSVLGSCHPPITIPGLDGHDD